MSELCSIGESFWRFHRTYWLKICCWEEFRGSCFWLWSWSLLFIIYDLRAPPPSFWACLYWSGCLSSIELELMAWASVKPARPTCVDGSYFWLLAVNFWLVKADLSALDMSSSFILLFNYGPYVLLSCCCCDGSTRFLDFLIRFWINCFWLRFKILSFCWGFPSYPLFMVMPTGVIGLVLRSIRLPFVF